MKQFLLVVVLFVSISASSYAQSGEDVLMKVGNSNVTVDEFRYIYEKNNGNQADYSKKSVEEYLDLYTKFKLKVQEAKAMQLDTVSALKNELKGYRDQLASSFMLDKQVTDKVVNQVYERKKYDVPVRHILKRLLRIDPQPKKDEAEKLLKTVRNELAVGIPFDEAVVEYTDDKNSKNNGGNIGYVTAMLPNGFYDLENAIYEAKPGTVVGPVWSNLGCHLIKVGKKRPARGILKVAHLLVRVEKGDNQQEKLEQINKIHEILSNNGNWRNLVAQHSEDTQTKNKGGELPIFGISTYERSFEDAAHELKNVGDFSMPVKTRSGYHIIKLLEKVPAETKEEIKKRLRPKIQRYDRYGAMKNQLIEKIKKEADFTEDANALNAFKKTLNKDFYSYKWKVSNEMPEQTLISFTGKEYTTKDFANYCKKNIRKRSQYDEEEPIKNAVSELYSGYVTAKTLEYAQQNLEEQYPAFRSLMREYQEGILLFEATKRSVWDKANQDSIGLQKFYEQNKSAYKYGQRVKLGLYTINSTDQKQIKKITKCAKKRPAAKTLKRFNKNNKELVAFSEEIVNSDNKGLSGLQLKKGYISKPLVDKRSNTTTFKKVIEIEKPRIKSLNEARGYVVADYQDKLEVDWVKKLQNKFSVQLYRDVLEKLIK